MTLHDGIELPMDRVETTALYARFLGRQGQQERAPKLLHVVLREAENHGAELLVPMLHRELRAAGGRRRGSPRTLSPAQLDVAELAARGLTIREIGRRLRLSIHTVECHTAAIKSKLGIEARRLSASHLEELGRCRLALRVPPRRRRASSVP